MNDDSVHIVLNPSLFIVQSLFLCTTEGYVP